MSRFPRTSKTVSISFPQDYDLYAEIFGPLGVFMFSFVKLEREVTWSYVSWESRAKEYEFYSFQESAAKFEASNKRCSDRVSKWFRSLRSEDTDGESLAALNSIKTTLLSLNDHRNRLAHDPSGSLQRIAVNGEWSEPNYHFNQQLKTGEVLQRSYSPSFINSLSDMCYEVRGEIRGITYKILPDAPKILI